MEWAGAHNGLLLLLLPLLREQQGVTGSRAIMAVGLQSEQGVIRRQINVLRLLWDSSRRGDKSCLRIQQPQQE
jgi:hypothetical protein